MRRKIRIKNKVLKGINQVPGEMIYVGKKDHRPTTFDIFSYNGQSKKYCQTDKVEDLSAYTFDERITWINIKGLNDTEKIGKLGKYFDLHSLLLEDLVNTEQRPKYDEYDNCLFVVLKMYYANHDGYVEEHLSFVMGQNYLLTFQETGNDVFGNVRNRINKDLGRIRKNKSDYLMYSLMDAIIDNYFIVMDALSAQIENLEDLIFLGKANEDIVKDIQNLKREIMQLRRNIYPIREMTGRLEISETSLIEQKTYNYLRDLHDHGIQISEYIEIYREMIWGLMDMYISTLNNKMNEVMKVLTIMASIFIPLTFLAGIYGMNFDVMPELHWKYGYLFVWTIMVIIVLLQGWYFKHKKWW